MRAVDLTAGTPRRREAKVRTVRAARTPAPGPRPRPLPSLERFP